MKRFGTLATILLIATSFVLAAPAAADDVQECTEVGEADLCVYDYTDGDREEACDESGSGSYEAVTGAEASTGEEAPRAEASAAGEESCEHGWSYSETEQIAADAEVCVQQPGFFCTTGAEASIVWDEKGIKAIYLDGVEVSTPAAGAEVGARWAEGFDGDSIDGEVDVCLETTGYCEPSAYLGSGWADSDVDGEASACLQRGFFFCDVGAGITFFWGEDYAGECTVFGDATVGGTYQSAEQPCPAGASPPAPPTAPGAPNPGWGDLTPDSGE